MNIDNQSESTSTIKRFEITLDDGRQVIYREFLDEAGKFMDDEVESIDGDLLDDESEVLAAIRILIP